MKKKLFRGVCTALVTPFTEQGALDVDALQRLIVSQLENEADALVVCGTTGEGAVLSTEEKQRIFQTAVRLCRGKVPVIAGVGCNDTRRTVQLAQLARQCGVDGLLVVTPYYNKTTQTGALQHFTAVAQATDLPLLLYDIPSRTGMQLAVETVRRLAMLPTVAGIKEAGGDMARIARLRAVCADDFAIYAGNDAETLPVLALGGDGVISVTANLLPQAVHRLCAAFFAGKLPQAQALCRQLQPLTDLLFETVNPIAVKAVMEAVGLPCGPCRLPLEQLSETQRRALQQRALPLLAAARRAMQE